MSGKRLFHLLLITCLFVSVAFMMGCAQEYEVEVQTDPEEAGEIEGEGTYEEGEKAKVEVDQEEGYEFKGWYKDGERVSEAEEYELEIEENKELVAEFEDYIISDEKLETAIKEELGVEQISEENIKDLTTLDASGEDITNIEGIEYAVNLEELDLRGTEVTDEGVEHLPEADNLEELWLGGKITDDGIKHLAEADNLEELNLANTEVTDEGVITEGVITFKIEQDTDLAAKFDENKYKIMEELNPDSTFEFGQKPELTDVLVYDDIMFYFHYVGQEGAKHPTSGVQAFGELYFQGNDINSKETVIKEKIDDNFDIGHNQSPSLHQYDDLLIIKHSGHRGISSHGVIAYDINSLEEVYRRQTEGTGRVVVEDGYFYKRAYNSNEEDLVYKKYSLENGEKVGEVDEDKEF